MNQELGGNITLSGFDMDGSEMVIVRKMVGHYASKIRNVREYKSLELESKTHKKLKKREFEIRAHIVFDGFFVSSELRGENPFNTIDLVLKKCLSETEHKIKNK